MNASMTRRRDDQTPIKMQSKVQVPRKDTVKSGLKRMQCDIYSYSRLN